MAKDKLKNISSLYEDWFLDYASYVILERAIPNLYDGFKPVQRRILHTMKQIHDNRYHKVANIIGRTMQYHPHGDQAIGDALVKLGQKNLLIDMQGNWGDIRTGDKAAAPRYIEAKLSEFALEVLFDKNITDFQPSYDGRNEEPVLLPVKFPLVLLNGSEGIAVGLSTKILPHNFNELIKASISILKGKTFKIYPDFQNGGMIDVSKYEKGKKGGKIRARAHIEIIDKTTLSINSIPYGITTTSLIDSIIKASNNGKIKIKNIQDNTAEKIEIIVNLVKGVSPNVVIDALYAFTNCEISISPNCCVINNDKPEFLNVHQLLEISTNQTVKLLKEHLVYNLNKLNEKWHFYTLEQIFIEQKIYRKIEDCETWDSVIDTIQISLNKYSDLLNRDINKEDIIKLTEIKIKRISKYNSIKHKEELVKIENNIKEVENDIENITYYSIRYFEHLLKKYGQNNKRLSEISLFDSISARRVVEANKKLYVNKKEGFIGTNLKKDELVSKCSDLDNIIIFLRNGKYLVTKVADKKYIGKDIIHVSIWRKNNKNLIYNIAYKDGLTKFTYVKRFSITSILTDKIYDITQGNDGSLIEYFTANDNSESEIINIYLHSSVKVKNRCFEYDYDQLAIKSRTAKGNILTKLRIRKIDQKAVGESTLGGLDIWLDESIGRLNQEDRGVFLGSFNSEDKIITFYKDGTYILTNFELTNRYNMSEIIQINKFSKDDVVSIIYYNGDYKKYYVKRFYIESLSEDKKFNFISDSRGSKLISLTLSKNSNIEYSYRNKRGEKKSKIVLTNDFISIKGWKAIGKILDNQLRMSGIKFISIKENKDLDSIKDNDNSAELTLF